MLPSRQAGRGPHLGVVCHRNHGRVDARAQALHLAQREHAVLPTGRSAAGMGWLRTACEAGHGSRAAWHTCRGGPPSTLHCASSRPPCRRNSLPGWLAPGWALSQRPHRRGLAVVDAQVVLQRLVDALGALQAAQRGAKGVQRGRMGGALAGPAQPPPSACGSAALQHSGCHMVLRSGSGDTTATSGAGGGVPPAACTAWCRTPSRGTCRSCCG